ncbi:MAG: hypothetical protein ACYDC6_10010 [Acidobacteriaceae bacterium]
MAAEKLCKAHVIMASGYDRLKKTHAYVATVLPVIARQFYAHENDRNKIAQWEIGKIKSLAGEIELLCPACHAGKSREDNSEYPWLDAQGKVQVPCQYAFPGIDDGSRDMVRLIRLIRAAAKSYVDNASYSASIGDIE